MAPNVCGWSRARAIMCHLHHTQRRGGSVIDSHRHITTCSADSLLRLNLTRAQALRERRRTSPVLPCFFFLPFSSRLAAICRRSCTPNFTGCSARFVAVRRPFFFSNKLPATSAARSPRMESAVVTLAVQSLTTWHDPDSQSRIQCDDKGGSVPPVQCSCPCIAIGFN